MIILVKGLRSVYPHKGTVVFIQHRRFRRVFYSSSAEDNGGLKWDTTEQKYSTFESTWKGEYTWCTRWPASVCRSNIQTTCLFYSWLRSVTWLWALSSACAGLNITAETGSDAFLCSDLAATHHLFMMFFKSGSFVVMAMSIRVYILIVFRLW